MPRPLTDTQLAEFDTNGFLALEPVFGVAELEAIGHAADLLLDASGPVVAGNPRVAVEKEADAGRPIVRKLEPVIDLSPELSRLAADPRLTAPAAQIFGEAQVYLFEDKLNYKPPRVGSAYALHQDYAYWQEYTDRLLTVGLHLDDATAENGCLRFVPGSHKSGLMDRPEGQNIITWDVDPALAVDVPGKAGSLVLFTAHTAHHSYPNTTDRGRRTLLCTYNPASEGDLYPIYKGQEAQRCQEWLAGHRESA